MKQILIILLILLFYYGCNIFDNNYNYDNKYKYEINVGETVQIYYSTNSCCYYCITNKHELNHVDILETKTIDTGPEDCAGCNYMYALVFKAESVGIDTVVQNTGSSAECKGRCAG